MSRRPPHHTQPLNSIQEKDLDDEAARWAQIVTEFLYSFGWRDTLVARRKIWEQLMIRSRVKLLSRRS